MSHILIATLGDSPVVVTAMFYLLTEKEGLSIDKVILLHPQGDNRSYGYLITAETLETQCVVDSSELSFEDTDTEETCFTFLRHLFELLDNLQQEGHTVYLSLAGGRKNMSALTALAAPFFQCVKGLYHVIDKSEHTDRKNFKDLQKLIYLYESNNQEQLMQAMHPDLDDLRLVPIPLDHALHIPEAYRQKLLEKTPEQLQELWENDPEQAEAEQFIISILEPNSTLPLQIQVYFTEQAKKEYEHFAKYEANLAKNFALCFNRMRFITNLQEKKHLIDDKKRQKPYPCYVYKIGSTKERPFFHTEPEDIARHPKNRVDSVIIERLTLHRSSEKFYEPPVEQLLATKYNRTAKLYTLEKVLDTVKPIPSILIVPMGAQPMVATQLYTLLTERERRDIQEVILLYPEDSYEVANSVQTAISAFRYEKIPCCEKPVPGLEDVASQRDCVLYQDTLEQTIQKIQGTFRQQHPNCRIDLALSGGRKGMAALALFAAQRTQLREVYHTLIANKDLDQQIEFSMRTKEFSSLSPKEQNDKLFLRAYKAHKADFRLFKIPIGPLLGK